MPMSTPQGLQRCRTGLFSLLTPSYEVRALWALCPTQDLTSLAGTRLNSMNL